MDIRLGSLTSLSLTRSKESGNSLSRALPLRDQCLLYLVGHLEEIPIQMLGLLPRAIRHELLLNLPPVDVHKLEETQIANDIDMEEVWRDIYWSRCPDRYSQEFNTKLHEIFSDLSIERRLNWKAVFLLYILHTATYFNIEWLLCSCPIQLKALLFTVFNSSLFPTKTSSLQETLQIPFTGTCFNTTVNCQYCRHYLPFRKPVEGIDIMTPYINILHIIKYLYVLFNFKPSILLLNVNVLKMGYFGHAINEQDYFRQILDQVQFVRLDTDQQYQYTTSVINLLDDIFLSNDTAKVLEVRTDIRYSSGPVPKKLDFFEDVSKRIITNQSLCCLQELRFDLMFIEGIKKIANALPQLKTLQMQQLLPSSGAQHSVYYIPSITELLQLYQKSTFVSLTFTNCDLQIESMDIVVPYIFRSTSPSTMFQLNAVAFHQTFYKSDYPEVVERTQQLYRVPHFIIKHTLNQDGVVIAFEGLNIHTGFPLKALFLSLSTLSPDVLSVLTLDLSLCQIDSSFLKILRSVWIAERCCKLSRLFLPCDYEIDDTLLDPVTALVE